MDDDDNESADLNLRRAQADAELAIAIARETQSVRRPMRPKPAWQQGATPKLMKAHRAR